MDKKLAIVLALLSVLFVGMFSGAMLFPREIVHSVNIPVEKLIEVEVPVEVPVEVIKEVMVEVPVDNGNLNIVLENLYDNNGNVEYLLDDLDDDELNLIVERIVFSNNIKQMAIDFVKDEGVDELDKEQVGSVELDDKDIEKFKVDDEDDEVIIDEIDFEDSDVEVLVTVSFEQDDVDYEAEFRVTFDDGEIDDFELEGVWLE